VSLAIDGLLWISAIGTGLMAGVYFAFSVFIMASLRATPAGAAAMQSINRTILSSGFMPLFFGTTLTSLAAAIIGALSLSSPGAVFALLGGVLYVAGMFLVTVFGNVPLNNALDAADPDSPEGAATWQRYLTTWTRWNHLRTIASTLAAILFIAAIAAR